MNVRCVEQRGEAGNADAAVLRRRAAHERVAQWMARWQFPLQALFAMLGLFVVLMPLLLAFWRDVVMAHALAAWVHTEFSRMGPWATAWLLFLVAGPLVALHFMAHHYPSSWDVRQQWGFPSPSQIVRRRLYPRTQREEGVFWLAMLMDLLGTTLWLYLPFGVLAYSVSPAG